MNRLLCSSLSVRYFLKAPIWFHDTKRPISATGVWFRGDLLAFVPVVTAELGASRLDSCYSVCSWGFQLDQHCRLSQLAQKGPKGTFFFFFFLLRSFKVILKNTVFISFQQPMGCTMKDMSCYKCNYMMIYIWYAKGKNEEEVLS